MPRRSGESDERVDRDPAASAWRLAPGTVIGHYRVLAPLGAGGMAQVYLAEDVRLGRQLALKVLSQRALGDDERLRRFETEARAVSALNHPNILTIYDVGHADGTEFLATEYIDGVTLRSLIARGPLDVRDALDISIQIAQAVGAAHDAGVIHRDLKPENVMVRPDGYVKVLDFGLAKLTVQPPFWSDAMAMTQLGDTSDGVILGTFNYMAPEQARGSDLDARADLFALGVLLYEMLAGHPPFTGATAADAIGALIFREPEMLSRADVPESLHRVVSTALRKDREERYQTCAQLLEDLREHARSLARSAGESGRMAAPGPPAVGPASAERTSGDSLQQGSVPKASGRRRRGRRAVSSLAVLPFANRQRDADLEYFSDGLTESLINTLSQLPRLRVMARSTVFRYRHQSVDARAIGQRLGVQAVLLGRVEQHGDEFVVAVELVDVEDGSQLWGARFSRRRSDVFALQGELAHDLAEALRITVTSAERRQLAKRHTANAEAYQLYLRGRYLLNNRTIDALTQARALFERAVDQDPQYALAHAGLADCCSLTAVSMRGPSSSEVVERARTAAARALMLDPTLADAHASLAFIRFRFEWDWTGADAEFNRALELNPGHAPARQWYAMYLASRQRVDAALEEMTRASEHDPLSLVIQSGIGRILHFAGRVDEAISQYVHVLETNPEFAQARIDLALCWMARGDIWAARASLASAAEALGQVSTILLLRACCDVREGRLDDARAVFEELRARYDRGAAGADDLAMLAAVLGDSDVAVAWLAEACAQRSPFLGYVDVEPAMAPLLADPQCRAVLERYGFGRRT
jgi:serine/threonine protein kinase/tetratricopeptide (TPR) repeat protein